MQVKFVGGSWDGREVGMDKLMPNCLGGTMPPRTFCVPVFTHAWNGDPLCPQFGKATYDKCMDGDCLTYLFRDKDSPKLSEFRLCDKHKAETDARIRERLGERGEPIGYVLLTAEECKQLREKWERLHVGPSRLPAVQVHINAGKAMQEANHRMFMQGAMPGDDDVVNLPAIVVAFPPKDDDVQPDVRVGS